MWKRKRKNVFGGSILPRWRYRDNGTDGLGGGTASTPAAPVEVPDVPPVNGGPDRDFSSLSALTVDDPATGSVTSPATSAQPSNPLVPADPNQRAGVVQPDAAQAQDGWQSIRDAAAAQGFQFDQTVTDDRTALNFLLRQAQSNRSADMYAQLGRHLAPQAPRIQQFLQQQQAPAVPAQRPAWEAPEFDERWLNLVERDQASGLFYARQGVDPAIAQKVNEFAQWKANYDRNPAAVINGMVESRAREISRETYREQNAEFQREQTIQQILGENSQWLYQPDATGGRARDFQGNYIYTPLGAAYVQQLHAVSRMGVTDPRQQDALAKQLVRGQYAQAAQAQAYAQQQQQANPQTNQAVNQPNVNILQTQPAAQRRQNPAATDPSEAGLSLMERMMRNMAAEGVTDTDIANSAGF